MADQSPAASVRKDANRGGFTAWSYATSGCGSCPESTGYRNSAAGGAGGIRTLDTVLPYTHFPGERLRPLGHRSAFRWKGAHLGGRDGWGKVAASARHLLLQK